MAASGKPTTALLSLRHINIARTQPCMYRKTSHLLHLYRHKKIHRRHVLFPLYNGMATCRSRQQGFLCKLALRKRAKDNMVMTEPSEDDNVMLAHDLSYVKESRIA